MSHLTFEEKCQLIYKWLDKVKNSCPPDDVQEIINLIMEAMNTKNREDIENYFSILCNLGQLHDEATDY